MLSLARRATRSRDNTETTDQALVNSRRARFLAESFSGTSPPHQTGDPRHLLTGERLRPDLAILEDIVDSPTGFRFQGEEAEPFSVRGLTTDPLPLNHGRVHVPFHGSVGVGR